MRASVLASVYLLSACGGAPDQTSTEAQSAGEAPVRSVATALPTAGSAFGVTQANGLSGPSLPLQRGVMLAGLPGENAFDALQFYAVVDREVKPASKAAAAAIPSGPLKATLDLTATVGQVNAALNAVGGRIVGMQPRRKFLIIELMPVAGALMANQQAASKLVSSRAFQWVQGPGMPAMPEGPKAAPSPSDPIDHDGPSSS